MKYVKLTDSCIYSEERMKRLLFKRKLNKLNEQEKKIEPNNEFNV